MYDCGTSTSGTGECKYSETYKLLNGTSWVSYLSSSNYYKIILADGSLIWFRTHRNGCTNSDGNINNVCALIWIDINGSKTPNKLGKDTFVLYVTPYGVIPSKRNDCNTSGNGFSCIGHIVKYSNMNYPDGN